MARFWPKVRIDPNGCWEWMAAKDRDGYGAFNPCDGSGRKVVRAHRYLFERRMGGPVDPELVVMHTCDNRSCVNPGHLALGTHAENIADRDRKGRHWTPTKLDEGAVRDIRRHRPRRRVEAEPLAAKYGVTVSAILHASRGRTWRHLAA